MCKISKNKTTMKKILLLISILFIWNSSFSQKAPGYMGKRFVPSYSFGFAPTIFNPKNNGEKGIFNFNLFHQIKLDYVTSRKSSFGIGYETYSTGVDYDNGYDNYISDVRIYFSGYGILNVKGFQLYKSFYRSGIAPMGKKHSVGIKVLFSSTDFENVDARINKSNSYSYYSTTSYEIKKGGTSKDFGLTYGYSSSRIIFDKLVLSFGFDVNLIYSAHFKYLHAYLNGSEYNSDATLIDQTEEEYLNDKAKQRVFSSQLLMIKIGIGFLAY